MGMTATHSCIQRLQFHGSFKESDRAASRFLDFWLCGHVICTIAYLKYRSTLIRISNSVPSDLFGLMDKPYAQLQTG
jgi:hypothetical protein